MNRIPELKSEYDEAEVMELFKEEGREEGISLFILDKLNDHIGFDVIKERLISLYGIKHTQSSDRSPV